MRSRTRATTNSGRLCSAPEQRLGDGLPPPAPGSDAVPAAGPWDRMAGGVLPRAARVSRPPILGVGGLRRRLRVQLGLGQLLGRAPAVPRMAVQIAYLCGARDAARAPDQLPARVLDRLPRWTLEEPVAG